MAQSDCRDENGSIIATLQSCSGDSHPVSRLISQIQTMKTQEQLSLGGFLETNSVQDSGGLEESSDLLNQPQVCKYGPHGASRTLK